MTLTISDDISKIINENSNFSLTEKIIRKKLTYKLEWPAAVIVFVRVH